MLRMGRGFKNDAPEKEKNPEVTLDFSPTSSPTPQPVSAPPPAARVAPAMPTHDAASAASSRAVTESEALARDIKEGIMNGFVGSTTVLSGDAEFKGMLRIDGRFTGRISSDKGTLIISGGGYVEANVQVATARINGTVNGDVIASERIELGRTAQVHGNIQTPALIIEHGAIFEGSCRMKQANAPTETVKPREAEAQTRRKPERDVRVPFTEKVKTVAVAEAVK